MQPEEAQNVADAIIGQARALFYNGEGPTVFGMVLVPTTRWVNSVIPNGNLTPLETDPPLMGMELSTGLLAIPNPAAVKFAIGHELGHAFSETILAKIGLRGVGGYATEVIADLASAYILMQIGIDTAAIQIAVNQGVAYGIFDVASSGDHPAGKDRARHVEELFQKMASGKSFEDAARQICKGLPKRMTNSRRTCAIL